MVELGEDLVIGRSVTIAASEMTWRFSASGGPGGQHANTSNTRVELVIDLESVAHITPVARERLIARYGSEISIAASEHRSQYQNRRAALQRLDTMLRSGIVVQRNRVATKPTLGSKRRRLDDKRRQSERKADRRSPGRSD